MIEPKRLMDDRDVLGSAERRVMAADSGFRAPVTAKADVWNSIAAAVSATAAVASLSSSAAASSAPVGTSATAIGTSAGHALTLGAVTKLVLLGVGIGTSIAVVDHIWFSNETTEAARLVEPVARPSAPNAVKSAAPGGIASNASPPEANTRVQDNPVERGAPNRTAEPGDEPWAVPSEHLEEPTIDAPSASRQVPTLPESMQAAISTNARDESLLISGARSTLRAGNAASALQLLDHAASRFPQGVLVQEREALRIEALVALGRTGEARARAQAFITAYPNSPHLGRVRPLTNIRKGL